VDQLKIQIQLAQMELVKLTPGSLEAVKIQADIDDYKLSKKKKSDAFDDAFSQLQKSDETLHEAVMRHEPSGGDGLWDWASAVYERWVSKAVRVPATTCRMVMVSSLGGYFLILRSINRDCTPPRDARSCETSIAGLFKRLDPVCEAAKAAQNQIYDSQRVACESRKAAERAQCEARKQFCFSAAKVCSDDREKAAASNIEGTLVLWVDDHPDNNLYERQALTELGGTITPASNTQEALSKLEHFEILEMVGRRTAKSDAIISNFRRSDDPQAGHTLLAAVLKLRRPSKYIIYSSSSSANFASDAKAKGAFGETNRVDVLFELVISAVKNAPGGPFR
jgi:CheY-like chemotaxis protein